MTILGKSLAVALPDTVLEEKDSLREKTVKLGIIARACAIYGVDVVEVFSDKGGMGEGELVVRVLEYLETPQYLRKRLFPLDESLRFAGLLPPLRIPSHKPKVALGDVRIGDFREGVANGDGSVDVGLDAAPKLKGPVSGKRITVRITGTNPLTAELVHRKSVPGYWGYSVEQKTFDAVFADQRFRVKIATSRLGDAVFGMMARLRSGVEGAEGVKLVFGSPTRGLFDMDHNGLRSKATFVLNLFAEQHVETVRTEEAVFAGLGLVNLLLSQKA